MRLELIVNEGKKVIEIWLSHEDQENSELMASLKPMYEEYKKKKFLVAVFKSGKHNLSQLTSDLLCYNRKQLAALEVQKEKAAMT